MSAYTKGPWMVMATGLLPESISISTVEMHGDDAWVIADAFLDIHPPESAGANARLLAAAPDSHEANVKTVEAFNAAFGINETWPDDRIYDDLPSSGLALAYFAARAAIAKATGASA